MEKMCTRRLAFRFLLIICSTIIALLAAELALRVTGYCPRVMKGRSGGWGSQPVLAKDTPEGVLYIFKPDQVLSEHWINNPRGYFDYKNDGLRYRINNRGFRGKDYQKSKTGGFRIAFLGDSLCWGQGVKREDRFTEILQTKLNTSGELDTEFEVYNFGLPGYSLVNEVNLFRETVLDFKPDMAAILFYINDIDPRFGRGVMTFMGGNKSMKKLRQYSYLADLIVGRIDESKGEKRVIEFYQRFYKKGNKHFVNMEKALEEFAALCRENDIVPLVAIHPVLMRLDDSHPFLEQHAMVKKICRKNDIMVLDLFEAYKGRDGYSLWVHPTDGHPNQKGHEITAEALARFIKARQEKISE